MGVCRGGSSVHGGGGSGGWCFAWSDLLLLLVLASTTTMTSSISRHKGTPARRHAERTRGWGLNTKTMITTIRRHLLHGMQCRCKVGGAACTFGDQHAQLFAAMLTSNASRRGYFGSLIVSTIPGLSIARSETGGAAETSLQIAKSCGMRFSRDLTLQPLERAWRPVRNGRQAPSAVSAR